MLVDDFDFYILNVNESGLLQLPLTCSSFISDQGDFAYILLHVVGWHKGTPTLSGYPPVCRWFPTGPLCFPCLSGFCPRP